MRGNLCGRVPHDRRYIDRITRAIRALVVAQILRVILRTSGRWRAVIERGACGDQPPDPRVVLRQWSERSSGGCCTDEPIDVQRCCGRGRDRQVEQGTDVAEAGEGGDWSMSGAGCGGKAMTIMPPAGRQSHSERRTALRSCVRASPDVTKPLGAIQGLCRRKGRVSCGEGRRTPAPARHRTPRS